MGPKKHTRSASSANVQSAPKKAHTDEHNKENVESSADEHDHDHCHDHGHGSGPDVGELDKEPRKYMCITAPPWDTDGPKEKEGPDAGEKELFSKPASEHPDHKWVMMWQSWKTYGNAVHKMDHTDPDAFGMCISNDFHSYGLAEILEAQLAAYDKAKTAHTNSSTDDTLLDMWSQIAAIAHWINMDGANEFTMMDDGDKATALVGLTGCALIDALNTIDEAEQLKKDSIIKDLGLVMSMYLKYGTGQEQYGMDGNDLNWRAMNIAFAQRAEIDLAAVGCKGTAKRIKENKADGDPSDLLSDSTKDYDWTETLRAYKSNHSGTKFGGDEYNIMKMTRAKRAKYAFDKKDPLADFSAKDIKAGKLALA